MFNAHFLFASLIWGSIGLGYFIYGKKQSSLIPMIGGVLLIAISFIVGSALVMSVVCLGLVIAMYLLRKNGY